MAAGEGAGKQLTPVASGGTAVATPNTIQLGTLANIDTSGLSPEQVQALQMKHAEGLIEINKKAQELKVDVGALGAGLSTMSEQTKQVSEAGNSVTITHTQTTSFGRTEVIMGNTDTAHKGKLSRSQAGLKDLNLMYVGIAAVVIVVLALILTHH